MCAAGPAKIGTHIHQQCSVSVSKFHHLTLIHFWPDRLAQFPGLSVIITVNSMSAIFVGATADLSIGIIITMVAGYHQPAFIQTMLDLNANARAGGIPAPFLLFRIGGNVFSLGPSTAVIAAVRHPACPVGFCRVLNDILYMSRAQVMGHDNTHLACFFIYHRTGIAAGIVPIVPNNLLRAPGLSAVFGTFEQNINIPCIAPMIFTTLAKSQDRSLGSGHQRRYPVSSIIADRKSAV